MDFCSTSVPPLLPSCNFLGNQRLGVQPAVEALSNHNVDLRFRHVQPASVLGRVMKLDLVQNATCFGWCKRRIQACPIVGVQIVLYEANFPGSRILHVHQLPHAAGVVAPGSPFGHPHVAPPPQRLAHHQLVANAFAFILIIHEGRMARTRSPRRVCVAKQLFARFVKANDRIGQIIRQKIGLNHILHAPDELRVSVGRDQPSFDYPRVDFTFFNACRTVSVLTAFTRPRTTISSASRRRVQRHRPSGGSAHASSINFCSRSPLILILSGRGGCGLWSTAASNPSVTKRLRTRSTVRRLTSSAVTISSSGQSSLSARSRMRACVSRRAATSPVLTKCCN